MKVLLPLRRQFLQREFLASAPEVCFFAFVRTNVIRELTQAEVGGNVGEVCSLVVSLLPTSLHYAGVVARFLLHFCLLNAPLLPTWCRIRFFVKFHAQNCPVDR